MQSDNATEAYLSGPEARQQGGRRALVTGGNVTFVPSPLFVLYGESQGGYARRNGVTAGGYRALSLLLPPRGLENPGPVARRAVGRERG